MNINNGFSIGHIWKIYRKRKCIINNKNKFKDIFIGKIHLKHNNKIIRNVHLMILAPNTVSKYGGYYHHGSNGIWTEPIIYISLKDLYNYKKFRNIIRNYLIEIEKFIGSDET
jgi:hypothetical protein